MSTITKKIFEPISNIGEDWCKLIDAKSGWLSNNYLDFVRVIKWYYDTTTRNLPKKSLEELITPVNTWMPPSCKDWLKAHGYVHDGKRSVLRYYIT